ncbi:hypothetical protein KSP40_PGU014959 [Platanthera guangdongensis]|uniref:non-specific serine/threonine protein kinase n=1 Tax=Platanthera guangdongensis TaxID=2320717 RepID=A0ABR2N438_9ASPA
MDGLDFSGAGCLKKIPGGLVGPEKCVYGPRSIFSALSPLGSTLLSLHSPRGTAVTIKSHLPSLLLPPPRFDFFPFFSATICLRVSWLDEDFVDRLHNGGGFPRRSGGERRGLGSATTVAIVASSGTVCGVLADFKPQSIQCARVGQSAFPVLPNISFSSVSGGRNFFCGLRSGGLSFFCWTVNNSSSFFLPVKRVYKGSLALTDLSVGEDQICAFERNITGKVTWWRNDGTFSESVAGDFFSLTSGRSFLAELGIAAV